MGNEAGTMKERIHFTASVNRILVPRLLGLGFRVEGDRDPQRWKEGCYFTRDRNRRSQSILFGRDKFGHALGWNIARERDDGTFEYMKYLQHGLTLAQMRYRTEAELHVVLERLVRFLDAEVTPWFEARSGTLEPATEEQGRRRTTR
jgi:hypothetical protein